VFQEISKAGNVGIWKKTLKSATGLSEVGLFSVGLSPQNRSISTILFGSLQGEIKKVLKHLLTINLVKEVKSVVHKAKKIYMLASLGRTLGEGFRR
jgi:RNA polymerase Rpc34 subunit